MSASSDAEAWLGRTLGRYRLDATIGAGGMGIVFRARDLLLERDVAIKVLLHDRGRMPERRARFVREARAAARLDHPHVVIVHDVGEAEETPYVALELVRGGTLREAMARSPDLATRLRWLGEIASALGAAHLAGIVHRDVKPENVLLTLDGVTKVADFGIAKHFGEAEERGARPGALTGEGTVLGTPPYMAPEQVTGEALDGRTDQFAWGIVAYELLTGVLPWGRHGDPPLASFALLFSEEPRPPSHFARGLDPALDAVVLRALARRVDERFETMQDARAALELAGTTLPGAAPTPAPGPELRSAEVPARTTTPVESARTVAGPGTTMLDVATPSSSHREALEAYGEALRWQRDGSWSRAAASFERALAADPALAPAALRHALLTRHGLAPSECRARYSRALQLRDALSPRDRALAMAVEPFFYADPPDFEELERRLRRLCDEHRGDAELHVLAGSFLHERAHALTLAWAEHAVSLDPGHADAWQGVALCRAHQGELEPARRALARSVELSPSGDDAYHLMASLVAQSGDVLEAERHGRRSMAIGPTHLSVEVVAGVLHARGRPLRVVGEMLRQRLALLDPSKRGHVEAADAIKLLVLAGELGAASDRLQEWEASTLAHDSDGEPRAVAAALGVHLELEAGRAEAGAARALRYLEDRDLWSRPHRPHVEPVGLCTAVAERGGGLRRAEAVAERRRHLEQAAGSRGPIWALLYGPALEQGATNAALQEEAEAARPVDDTFGFFRFPLLCLDSGLALLRLGELPAAIAQLSVAARTPLAPSDPFRSTHAHLHLAEALASAGRVDEAASAARVVVARWGDASPPSLSAARARDLLVSLATDR